jgi:site-specific recombinase XerD
MSQALCYAAEILAPGSIPASTGKGAKGNLPARLRAACSLPWGSLRVDRLGELRAQLLDKGLSPASVNKVQAAVRGTLEQAWRSGMVDSDTLARAKDTLTAVKGSTLPAGRHVKRVELRRLFEACEYMGRGAAGARDAALLALLATGIRRAEVADLKTSDYEEATGRLVVRGKGRKERVVFLVNGAKQAVDEWIALSGRDEGPILRRVNKSGAIKEGGLSAQAVYSRLRLLSSIAGVTCTPHDLRRTMAGDALDAGIDVVTLQSIMGHSSPSTTARYDRRPEAKKREAMELLSLPYKRV